MEESSKTFELIIITLLIIIVVFVLNYLREINEKYHNLEKKYSALLRKEQSDEKVNDNHETDRLNETIASMAKIIEESQNKISEAHMIAQKSYAELAAVSEQHSERLFQELKSTQKLLSAALQKNEKLIVENAELSKEIHELKLKVSLLESILATRRSSNVPFVAKINNETGHLPLTSSFSSSSSSLKPSTTLLPKFDLCRLYGDEINLTAAIPDKPFDYLSDEVDIQTSDKRLYMKKRLNKK